ncbi:MAG: hypothetical protein M0014_01625 [Actinomycetota bacterium]|jgi:hypothetical protein|nr:hypothetical protein [Actinomycetota bacterium]
MVAGGSIHISCEECVLRHSDACEDCVVTYVLGREPSDAIVIGAEEARAVRMLQQAGLVPALRHERRVG